ncbi:MAG: hypothetical protein ACRC5C_00795, partial [Bacilli bacterium]
PIEQALPNLETLTKGANERRAFYTYRSEIDFPTFALETLEGELKRIGERFHPIEASVMRQSDYNALLQMQNRKSEQVNLSRNQLIIVSENDDAKQIVEEYLSEKEHITLFGEKYQAASNKVGELVLANNYLYYNHITFVVPDEAVAGAKKAASLYSLNWSENANTEVQEANVNKALEKYNETYAHGWMGMSSATQSLEESKGMGTFVVYIGIYLGIVTLISSAAVLALQQLSDAADNTERYRTLERIGLGKRAQNRTLLRQVALYFFLPFALALVHSIFGIKVVNNEMIGLRNMNIIWPSIFTAMIFTVVYGGYFWATYMGCKNIIQKK